MRTLMRSIVSCALPLLCALALLGGCSEERWDCRDICQTVQACVIVDIDVSDCTDLCTSYAFTNDATEVQAEACNDCLDVNACVGADFCSDVCSFVIAPID